MSVRVILLRHAKSSRDDPSWRDIDRPLAARGERDAPRVARRLADLGWTPSAVLCSPAVRARGTWQGLVDGGLTAPVAFVPELYPGSVAALRAVLARLGPVVPTVLLIGHNPALEETAQWLSGESVVLKTAGAVLLSGTTRAAWREAVAAPGRFTLTGRIVARQVS